MMYQHSIEVRPKFLSHSTFLRIAFRRCRRLIFLAIALATMSVQPSEAKRYTSTESSIALLELYTSQGCSSCPRAEKWLNQFVDHDQLWKKLIPINFHVDYWDYLGWKDPYAFSEFSRRQRLYKAIGNTRVIATPGFVLDGKGWSGWFIRQPVPVEKVSLPIGVLQVDVNNSIVSVRFSPLDPSLDRLKAKVVVLGFDQITSILKGENKGESLQHHFVAIAHNRQPLTFEQGQFSAVMPLPKSSKVLSPRKAIVVWIERAGSPEPLQVVGGWL